MDNARLFNALATQSTLEIFENRGCLGLSYVRFQWKAAIWLSPMYSSASATNRLSDASNYIGDIKICMKLPRVTRHLFSQARLYGQSTRELMTQQ